MVCQEKISRASEEGAQKQVKVLDVAVSGSRTDRINAIETMEITGPH